jgi:transketolase
MRLERKADEIRQDVIRVAMKNDAGHIAPSLSCIEILVMLYYRIMGEDDKLIFSKAHGGYGVYAILSDLGIINRKKWEEFQLPGCLQKMPGVTAGCGALGHGLPIAVGMAYASKLQNQGRSIFCIVGDGEMQEGSNWEAIQFAVKHKLGNLYVIIDNNRLQAMDFRVHFGVMVGRQPGHDIDNMAFFLETAMSMVSEKPTFLIAETVKGSGLKCIQNIPRGHFRVPGCAKLH